MPWNLRRELHLDISAAYGAVLLQSATEKWPRPTPPDMIAGDGMPIRLYFWEKNLTTGIYEAADPGATTLLTFSGRPAGAPTESDLLFLTDDFVEISEGVWEGTLDLTPAEFSAHLAADPEGSKTILGEVEIRNAGGTQRTSLQFDLTARPQVFQAEDVTPTPLPSPVGSTAPVNMRIIVAAAGNATANGDYYQFATENGKPSYSKTGDASYPRIYWSSGFWGLDVTGNAVRDYFSNQDVATPDLVTAWSVTGGEGTAPAPAVMISAGAGGIITYTGLPTNGQTLTVNGRAYTYRSTGPLAASEILIGADVEAMLENTVTAINSPAVGAANSHVTAVTISASQLVLFSILAGTVGNTYTLAEAATNTAVSGATLSGGIDSVLATATPPYLRVAGGFLYIQEAGIWKKVALSAL